MKIIKLIAILLVFACLFVSCSVPEDEMFLFVEKDEEYADKTFNELIGAINSKNSSLLKDLFARTIHEEKNIEKRAEDFFNFIKGNVVSYTSSSESGVGSNYTYYGEKIKKDIISSFAVKTTENTYYISIKECIYNNMDNNGIGITSLYIIQTEDWKKDFVFRGDGNWVDGINIIGDTMG